VLGASADPYTLNQKFTEKESYTYPLLCDTDLSLIQALGIENPGRKTPQRITFVLDKEGKIAKIYSKVTPKGHAEEVLKFVKEMDAKK
jgi:thioredoxin-dependent peroxiredoxin